MRLLFVLSILGFGIGCALLSRPSSFHYVGEESKEDFFSKLPRASHTVGEAREFHLIWPIDRAHLSQGFRPLENRSHDGIDLTNTRGTPILAAHDGWVIYRGQKYRGYGNMIILEHSDEWATLYAHLDKIYVKNQQFVKQGTVIGTMGRTGKATGVHLHFELIRYKQPQDPIKYLP